MSFAVFIGLAIDAIVGDPAWLYKRLWHPVVPVGRFAAWCDRWCNPQGVARRLRIIFGGIVWLVIVAFCFGFGFVLQSFLFGFGWVGVVLAGVIGSSLIAFRGLSDYVGAVATALETGGVSAGREAVRHLVGRDPESLNEAAVSRAAIESLAENFTDGTVSPLFWWLLLGLPGLCAYKAINTLDSMLGHRTERLEAFGKVSARLDDVANWVPARLSALVIWVASGFGPALKVALRDARHHRSPNAGWPEGAFAGALNIKLAGPRHYAEGWVDEPFIGCGSAALTAQDIRCALRLYWRCGALLLGLLLAGSLIQLI